LLRIALLLGLTHKTTGCRHYNRTDTLSTNQRKGQATLLVRMQGTKPLP